MRESLEGVGVGNPYERTDELTDGDLPDEGEQEGSVGNAREPYYSDDAVTLHHGDCLDVLRSLPDNSVDSVVCDPPYGLEFMGKDWDAPWKAEGAHWRSASRLPGSHSTNPTPRPQNFGTAGLPFQQWCEQWTAECLRVLKPGGHLLAFGGTRTWHRLACAVEDAGFEVRDSIAWLYGSGFPKSLDVSKAIDKVRNWTLVERLAEEIKRARSDAGMSLRDIGQAVQDATDGQYGAWYHRGGHMFFETGRSLPSRPEWDRLREVLPIRPEFADVYAAAEREVVGTRTTGIGTGRGSVAYIADGENRDITAPATPAAQQWQGWGTALKPAFEPVVVARKPLSGTVAANVLAHGTGALNVDGCRVPSSEPIQTATGLAGGVYDLGGSAYVKGTGAQFREGGRWPTNVVLDGGYPGSAAEEMDRQSGTTRSSSAPRRNAALEGSVYAPQTERVTGGHDDSGGASRFFPVFRYQAKAPTSERPSYVREGADGSVAGSPATSGRRCNVCGNQTVPKGGKPWPACGHDDWTRFETENRTAGKVAHPTVKPLALMQWLVRLVTPPGGVVLEPFAGSGTTVEACLLEGFRCIAIEREADYLPLIKARIARQQKPDVPTAAEALALFDFEEPA